MQRILHALKYGGNQPVGMKLGKMLGEILRTTDRFHPLDGIIPLPLHPKRLRQRGYNQSACIAQGCSIVTGLPVWDGWIYRDKMTETQTRKNRMARWQNLTGGFRMVKPSSVQGKHLLLLDDVVTTGASLEACAMALLAANPASVSIATIAYATQ